MHPRERVLGAAELLRQQKLPYPQKLIEEAERLGVTLPSDIDPTFITNETQQETTKENNDGN